MPKFTQTYQNLRWCALDAEQHERTCGYWYTVQAGTMSHTAFRTRAALLIWCAHYGLVIDHDAVPQVGTWSHGKIKGSYRRTSHIGERKLDAVHLSYVGGYDEFFAIEGRRIRIMDNGELTLGIVATDDDGIRNVHHLNCNMRDRPTFDYDGKDKAHYFY